MEKNASLSSEQATLMQAFYAAAPTGVIFNKPERKELWDKAKARAKDIDFDKLKAVCPALEHQIRRSYDSGDNIQSAVFSECVYAQTFANMMDLPLFVNCYEQSFFLPAPVEKLLSNNSLSPRYIYLSEDKRRLFVQAGGCGGIDGAFITVDDLKLYTVEFKEPGAKTSEPDLPKYGEDGVLVVTEAWLHRYPQFTEMLKECTGLNFFKLIGNNFHNFSAGSIEVAVSGNYTGGKKYASVICTEDKNGILVMLPADQVSRWAAIEGEIRPAGRNHYDVWTPNALKTFLHQKNAVMDGSTVRVPKANLGQRRERGGNRRISGYKINSIFFVYAGDCTEENGILRFDISNVQQLNPTIAGKMSFKQLRYSDVKSHYDL